MRRYAMAIALLVAMQSVTLAQTDQGSPEQQQACTPDVFRLCSSEIPDADRIVVCLTQKEALLSDRCRAVLDAGQEHMRETVRKNGTNR
jgi:hypothetical protein